MILAIDQGTTGTTCIVFDDEGRPRGRGYSEFQQHFPRPGWVEHDAAEIWEVTHRVATSRARGRSRAGLRSHRDRDHEPARDGRRLGPEDGRARAPRARLAGPPHRGALRRAPRAGARGAGPGAHRAGDRSLLLRDQDRVADSQCGPAGGHRVRDDRLLAGLQAHRRAPDRLLERLAHDAVRHPRARAGTTSSASCSASTEVRCPSRCPPRGSTARTSRVRRRGPCGGDRRGPAGGALRPGLPAARRGQEHLRHRELRPAQHRKRGARAGGGAARNRRLGPRGRPGGLRPGGGRLRHRRGRAVAAGRAGDHRRRSRDGGARRLARRRTTTSTSCPL